MFFETIYCINKKPQDFCEAMRPGTESRGRSRFVRYIGRLLVTMGMPVIIHTKPYKNKFQSTVTTDSESILYQTVGLCDQEISLTYLDERNKCWPQTGVFTVTKLMHCYCQGVRGTANTVGTAQNRRHSSQDKKKGKRDDRPVLSRCGFHSDDCVSIRPPGLRGRQPRAAETSCLPKPAQGQRFELAT